MTFHDLTDEEIESGKWEKYYPTIEEVNKKIIYAYGHFFYKMKEKQNKEAPNE